MLAVSSVFESWKEERPNRGAALESQPNDMGIWTCPEDILSKKQDCSPSPIIKCDNLCFLIFVQFYWSII